MTLKAIIVAVSIFLVLFALHIILNRFLKPKNDDKFVLLLFIVLPTLIFLGLPFIYPLPPRETLFTYALYFVTASSWVASYPAVYAACPTLQLSLLIKNHRTGISFSEIKRILRVQENSLNRVEDALRNKLIQKSSGGITLTPFGSIFADIFRWYRRILGLKTETI